MSVSFESTQVLRREAGPTPAPPTYPELIDEIARRRGSLSKQLEQCATFVLRHPEDVAFETAASLAARLDVSTSTLVRFASLFDLRGFMELRRVFRRHICGPNGTIPGAAPVRDRAKPTSARSNAILEQFLKANVRALHRLVAEIDPDAWTAAVEILASAEIIYLVAKRQFAPIADNVACLFAEFGVRCQQTDSLTGSDDDLLRLARAKDACLAISFSPYATETVRLVERLTKSRVPSVVMADTPCSLLVEFSTACLQIPEEECLGFLPLVGSLVLSTALGLAVARRRA